ncbi:MAG: ATP-binding cassette domain-containing protein [Deltaproteobacteria bacterium]|nr:ATP-binding cassette domain-containing protein [Deltaproteobacteria bacterium]
MRKRFGRVEALRGVDFMIPSGGKVGLIGPNASGKSTLIRIILRLLQCEGELLLDGEKKRRMELADRIAYVPQIAPKFGASVGEVIKAITRVRQISPDAVFTCGNEVGIDLRAVERQAFCNLSGGAKQKTLISLALASQASLYVLDEPTASLDTQSRRDMFHLLSERTEGATLILCSHRLEEIRTLVDRVMVLEEGRLAEHNRRADEERRRQRRACPNGVPTRGCWLVEPHRDPLREARPRCTALSEPRRANPESTRA